MSATDVGLHLSPQEALARDLIMQRVAARHRAERRRHPSRAALLLRSLADRLDHSDQAQGAQSLAPTHVSRSQVAAVATARKLAAIIWHLLNRQEDYVFARPSLVARKRCWRR